jgi:hypothetical protein
MSKPKIPPGFENRLDRDPPGMEHANENASNNSKLFEHLNQIVFTPVTVPLLGTDVNGDGRADNLGFDLDSGTPKHVTDLTTDFSVRGINGTTGASVLNLLPGLDQYAILDGQEVLELTDEILAGGEWFDMDPLRGLVFYSDDTLLFKTDEGQIFAVGDLTLVDNRGTLNDYVTFTYANVTEILGG